MNRYFWILGGFAALVALLAVGLNLNPRDAHELAFFCGVALVADQHQGAADGRRGRAAPGRGSGRADYPRQATG